MLYLFHKKKRTLAYKVSKPKNCFRDFFNGLLLNNARQRAYTGAIMKTIREVMDSDVNILDFSVRCRNCLERMQIKTVCQLTALSINDIEKMRNIGKKVHRRV